ncbi:MAG: carbohydrate binding family 9 domain-containing protein [Candidatus Aminicenantes bacterium]|jgi:hypothetical protein
MIKMKKLSLAIVFFTFFAFGFPGIIEASKEPHRVPRVTSKVRVDGVLDDEVWNKALKMELNYEVMPGENIKPPVRTEVLFAYSKAHLYVAFRAYDPEPTKIRATVSDRDRLGTDGYVAVILDPFNDSRRTYDFFCNPYGVQADMIESPDGGNIQWDAIWDSAGRTTDWGYCVEIAIPFTSLSFPRSKEDQVWGVDAIRSYPRNVRHHIGLFPRDRNNNCYMCQAEKLIGFKGVSTPKNLEINPTLSSIYTQEREEFPDGKFAKKESKIDPGFTARWSFTPNITLSTTINPDFSNVEADVAQLDINKQFALFYPEKRPFFLEDASIFNTHYTAVHTRSFADPNGGIKLTGKEGPHAIGLFSVQDNITNLLIPGSQWSSSTSLDMKSLGTVLRYRRDLGKASNLGVLVTDREGNDYFNRVASIDGYLRFSRKDRVLFQFMGSQTRYPDQVVTEFAQPEGDFWGTALYFLYRHDTRSFNGYVNYRNISSKFRSDLGFMTKSDFWNIDIVLDRKWQRKPGYWYTLLNLGTRYYLEKDHDNNLLYKTLQLHFNYTGPLQSYFNITGSFGNTAFMGIRFRENYLFTNAGFQPTKSFLFGIDVTFGDQIDYTNVQPGELLNISPEIWLVLGNHLTLRFSHNYERLDVESGRLYTANLTNLKAVYQFNRRTFLRVLLQYTDNKFTPELYPYALDPRSRHLFSQVLFSYKINPQTVLFLGYSDDFFGFREIPLQQNNRTVFLKIGYAFML